MLVVTREVFYCEFCKRHWLTKGAATKHESKCIYNPDRVACGWHEPHIHIEPPSTLLEQFGEMLDLDWLRDQVQDGCPACMLAVVVQARQKDQVGVDELAFDYKTEVERFRGQEREEAF